MNILTVENEAYSMNNIPDFVDDEQLSDVLKDIRYCVLDYSDIKNIDYIFIPLVFLESFNSIAVELRIGNSTIQMPIDWSVIIGDKNSGELEVIELKKLNDRPFQVFGINPISGYMPDFMDIEIINVFQDVKWFFPKLKFGHLLAVPLTTGPKPTCVFFVREVSKIPETLDITQLV
jgi:hypothetical protein